ncbi:tetratricopeptide repeat protein [candidate division WOR-3 bacterium]|nr:tetratricopeptide repeat protein [candidate division WOR-3 bacterium]
MGKKIFLLSAIFLQLSCSVKRDFDYIRDTVKDIDLRLASVEESAGILDSTTNEIHLYQREKDAYYLQNLENINMKIDALRQALQLSRSQLDALTYRIQNISDTNPEASAEAFELAAVDFSKGDYDIAEMALLDFVQNYRSSPKISDALFLLAESQFSLEKYEEAFNNYSLFRVNFPLNPTMPSALYKSGLCKLASGDTAESRRFFNDVIEAYPDSREAMWAKEKLR